LKISQLFFLLFFVCGGSATGYTLPSTSNDSTYAILKNVSVTDCNDHVLLQWDVKDNLIADHFEIERMDINGTFKTIALILSDNNSSTSHYSYKDKITLRDLFLFYRIKMITNKGESVVSSITPLKLKSTGSNLTDVDFNRQKTELILHLSFSKGNFVCRFYNVVGKMVETKTVKASTNKISIAGFKKGTYFMEIYHPQTGKRYYASFVK
jgi:hypothetical protein